MRFRQLYSVFCTLVLFAGLGNAQQPQWQGPVVNENVMTVNGVAPGYAPSSGGGLTLQLGGGTSFCNGSIVTYAPGTLTMQASATNYIYLDTTNNCTPTASETVFPALDFPIAAVVTGSATITQITDVRNMFQNVAAAGTNPGGGFPITLGTTAIQAGSTTLQISNLMLQNPNLGTSPLGLSCTVDTGGVTQNQIVSFLPSNSTTCAPTPANAPNPAIGVAETTQAAGSSVVVGFMGLVQCIADNNWVAGDFLTTPQVTPGSCYDTGQTSTKFIPQTTQIFGRAMEACTTGTACTVLTFGAGNYGEELVNPIVQGTATLNGPSQTFRGDYITTNNVNRWSFGADVEAESGNNDGSNFAMTAYSDTGTVIDTAFTINRATGQTTFYPRPLFGTNTPWDSGNLNFTNPPAIGGVVPNSGQFTALAATSFLNTGLSTLAGTSVTTFTASGVSSFTSTTPTAFTVRPLFNTYTPWDSGNFNPANYLSLSGGQMTGPLVNGAFGSSATPDLIMKDSGNTNGIQFFPVLATGSYNPIVVAGDTGIIAGATYNATSDAIDIAPWSTVASGGIRVAPAGVTINGATVFNTTPTAPTAASGTNSTALATTAYVMSAISGGSSSPTFTNLTLSGTLSVAGAATFNNPIYSNYSFIGGSGSIMQVPVIQVSGTGNTQGIQDSGPLNANGNTVLGGTLDVYGSTVLGSAGNDTTQVTGPLTALSTVNLHGYTVATLPAGTIGATAYVTNAVACTYMAAVAGAGTTFCPVIYNGTSWVAY